MATSPQHIAISQYARAYALVILCLMCAFLCLLRARHSAFTLEAWHRRLLWWLGYAVAGVAALYTHHTAAIVLAALNLAALLSSIRAGSAGLGFLKELLAANLLIAALHAPWLPVIAAQVLPGGAPSPAKIGPAATLLSPPLERGRQPISIQGIAVDR